MGDSVHQSAHGLTRKLAKFTHGFHLKQAPASVVANAKLAILDCLGVAVLAGTQEIGGYLRRFARANVASGNCTVWGMEIQSNARDAALLNGTLAHGLDYDDRNHSTTYTLASSIALTEGANAGGRKALEAFIVGREVRASLDSLFSHRSSGIGPGARGWHSNGILGPIASACSASKALKLGTTQTLAAIHRTSHLPKEEVLTVTLKNGKKLSDPFQPPNESYGAVANQRKIRPIGEPGFFAGTGTGNCGLCHASGRAAHEFTKNVTYPLASFLGKLPEGGKP